MGATGEETTGVDRRGFIKRAAAVGAATAWATPTVQSLAAPAFATGTAPAQCTACLTGGGDILPTATSPVIYMGKNARSITFGVGQLCCIDPGNGNAQPQIEVNAHPTSNKKDDKSYHFDRQLTITCSKTGNPAPPPQTADCANHFTGTAYDKDGNKLTFVFEDNGEGKGNNAGDVDKVSIIVTSPTNQVIMSGSGSVNKGNLQVHDHLGPIKRDCSGC